MFSYSTGYYVSPPNDQYLKFKNRCSLTFILLAVERNTPCTSILLVAEGDTHNSLILLAVERDPPYTFSLLAVEGIHTTLKY